MKKRKLGLGIALMTVLALHAHGQQYTAEADFRWAVMDNRMIITGYTGTSTVVRIPPQIQGMDVFAIGAEVFTGRGLTSISIPNGVILIGDMAFANNPLTEVTIPDSVIHIGNMTFLNNPPVASITIGNNIENIGQLAFAGGFESFFNANGRRAGTYTRSSTNNWSFQPR